MLRVYEKIVGLTDDVCDRHLDSEYRDLARAIIGALCRKRPSPLTSGQPRTWACGIVYVLGGSNSCRTPPCLRQCDARHVRRRPNNPAPRPLAIPLRTKRNLAAECAGL